MRMTPEQAQRVVDQFNKTVPIGTPIRIWAGRREGPPTRETTVDAPGAFLLGGHTAVVKVPGNSIALTHVEVALQHTS